MALRLDDTGFGHIKIYQEAEDFCYGVDAVLLADFAARNMVEKKAKNCADLGAGTGIIPLILSHKTKMGTILAVEKQNRSADIAKKNMKFNRLTERIRVLCADIVDLHEMEDLRGAFDAVTSNPPYVAKGSGLINRENAKMIARQETTGRLADFVAAAAYLLGEKGDFYMIHRPERLVDICTFCRRERLEPKEFRFISGKPNEAPNLVLIHCAKNGRAGAFFLPPLHIHCEDGTYGEELLSIYERKK